MRKGKGLGFWRYPLLWVLGALLAGPVFALVPRVVVSINPFYGLVAAVMQGVGVPTLLVKVGASPHEYSLRPSETQQLTHADLIVWGGPDLESFLIKPLADQETRTMALYQVPGLQPLALRTSMAFEPDLEASEAHPHSHGHHHAAGSIDMHFWLDPQNAIPITRALIKRLSQLDPEHQNHYQANGVALIKRLAQLDRTLRADLASLQSLPYVVFHDAYQYFEKRYHLNGAGSLSLHPELPLSAKRLRSVRAMITREKVICLFSEPQFSPVLVQRIAADLSLRTGVLDPIGEDVSANGYFSLIENLSRDLRRCLD